MEDSLRAYDWIRLAEQVHKTLAEARAKLAETNDHPREQAWIDQACELLSADAEARGELLSRARRLPELAAVRQEHAADLIGPWVDALEHLHAGIVYNAGLKSPLLEALFPHRKFDSLRRANLETATAYGADFHRRLTSSYIERLLGREEFAFAKPSVDDVVARFNALAPDGEATVEEEEKQAIVEALAAEAAKVELAIKQAKLLAEAALLPLPGAFEALGIKTKPKARSAKAPKEAVAEAEAPAPEPKEEAAPAPKPAKKKAAKEKTAPKEKAPKPAPKPAKRKKTERNSEASA